MDASTMTHLRLRQLARQPRRLQVRSQIALAPGDGIGPEIMSATLELLDSAGVNARHAGVHFQPVEMGASVFARAAPGA